MDPVDLAPDAVVERIDEVNAGLKVLRLAEMLVLVIAVTVVKSQLDSVRHCGGIAGETLDTATEHRFERCPEPAFEEAHFQANVPIH